MALQTLNCRVWLRYQHQHISHGDEMILSVISNHSGGTTVAVLQEDDGPGGAGQAMLRVIGTLDRNDMERINTVARPQVAGGHRARGGPRVGARMAIPDLRQCAVSNFSPQYNGYVGQGPHGAKPYVLLSVVCRIKFKIPTNHII